MGFDAEDIIGKRFGRWTVEAYAGKRNRNYMYECKCDCGRERNVMRKTLLDGTSTSCGCSRGRETIDVTDIVGERFGRWTVLSYAGKEGKKHLYMCRCECGTERPVLRDSLVNGTSASCGCGRLARSNPDDIVGNKYGRLTVIAFSHRTEKGLWYKCQCDCGNVVVEQKSHLTNYPNITCGDCTKIVQEGDHMRYICKNGDSFIFDAADIDIVSKHRWCIGDGYPQCVNDEDPEGPRLKLSRMLLNIQSSTIAADHINGDTRDNRRKNLRAANYSQNNWNSKIPKTNTSGYKGVSWRESVNKYIARIGINNKTYHIGSFCDPIEAARAYDDAARILFGEYAALNFPCEGEQGCRRGNASERKWETAYGNNGMAGLSESAG